MERNRSVRVWSVLKLGLKLSLALLLAASVIDGSASAQNSSGEKAPLVAPEASVPQQDEPKGHPFGTVYHGFDTTSFDQLPDAQKQQVTAAASWADTGNGDSVQQAWSAYTHKKAAEARVKRAAYQAGTNGLESVGVVP